MTSIWDRQRENLLPDIKNYLDVTWADEALENKLWDMAMAGMFYLDGKIGAPQDYLQPGLARALLMDYVRYARDGAADIFENNYLHLLLTARNERMVEAYEDAKNADPP